MRKKLYIIAAALTALSMIAITVVKVKTGRAICR